MFGSLYTLCSTRRHARTHIHIHADTHARTRPRCTLKFLKFLKFQLESYSAARSGMASEMQDLRMTAKHILRMTAKIKCGISTSSRFADGCEATFADDRQKESVELLPAITKYVCGRPRTAGVHTQNGFYDGCTKHASRVSARIKNIHEACIQKECHAHQP